MKKILILFGVIGFIVKTADMAYAKEDNNKIYLKCDSTSLDKTIKESEIMLIDVQNKTVENVAYGWFWKIDDFTDKQISLLMSNEFITREVVINRVTGEYNAGISFKNKQHQRDSLIILTGFCKKIDQPKSLF